MKKYMPKYAKQEGYAVGLDRIKEYRGTVHRWKFHHAEKYNNWRKQSDLVIDKKVLQGKINAGYQFSFSAS